VLRKQVWIVDIITTIGKTGFKESVVSTDNMKMELLIQAISNATYDLPAGLHWKMISMGTQDQIKTG